MSRPANACPQRGGPEICAQDGNATLGSLSTTGNEKVSPTTESLAAIAATQGSPIRVGVRPTAAVELPELTCYVVAGFAEFWAAEQGGGWAVLD